MRRVWSAAVVLAAVSIGGLSAQIPDAGLPAGDAARGRSIVGSPGANCLGCHRNEGSGSLYGPDLTAVAAPRGGGGGRGRGPVVPARAATREELTRSLLEPDAEVAVENRYVRLDMKDGRTLWGKLLNLDTFAVQIFDASEALASVSRDDVRELTMASPMPSYRDRLTPQELADVVAYLMTLTGQ
jgi:mono/diheme cytochrome c family protein